MKTLSLFLVLFVFGLSATARTVFDDSAPLRFSLSANLSFLFKHRAETDPATVDGTLTFSDSTGRLVVLHPKVKLRGNSSRQAVECPFPKLKLMFAANELSGTIFENHPTVGIGTHCSEQGRFSPLGRAWDGRSPHREVLAYEMVKMMEIPAYQARAAWINYIESTTGKSLGTHQALLLEDMDSLLSRYNGTKVTAPWQSMANAPGVTIAQVARIYFLEALLGNWDWSLKMDYVGGDESNRFWNMKEIQTADGRHIVFPYDFDLADIVTARNRQSGLENEIPKLFTRELRMDIGLDMKVLESDFRALGQRLENDPQGQVYFKTQMDRFFKKLPEITR